MKICILGSGNVAYHLSTRLQAAGHDIVQIYSRNKITSEEVANQCRAKAIQDLDLLYDKADLYLLAVNDNAIASVSKSIPFSLKGKQIIAHTAGSVPIESLQSAGAHYGSFYPLQTFSKSRQVSFDNIPICINGSDEYTINTLTKLALSISTDVRVVDDEMRKEIHLAAVIACNLTTHLIAEAESLLEDAGVDPSILAPLLQETISKVIEQGATQAQTGPARRDDSTIIDSHLKMLTDKPAIRKLYKLISTAIKNKYS